MNPITVPFLDLSSLHRPHREEYLAAIGEVIDSGAFAGGPYVAKFESDFAAFCRTRYCAGVGSGTEAIWLALLALGVGPGDEVITVPSTFMATAEAITYCGAKPVFVDIDSLTYTMDPALLEEAITVRTRAIIPVHLYGQMADMDPIMEIARRHHLFVIEDACQAHGAEYKGRKAGSIGDVGCFSFYPGKNLGGFGESGALVTNCQDLAQITYVLRDHGQARKYHHSRIGWNARMDGIQAAILRIKLLELERGNDARRAAAQVYDEALRTCVNVITPHAASNQLHVYHLYVVRVRNRDSVLQELAKRGIATGIHYPCPVHLQEAYRGLGYRSGSFPISEACAEEVLSLPMFPSLSVDEAKLVARELSTLCNALAATEATAV
jgi:dTDP-4-amino-4,6-dideoxygalactose transaminase